MSKLDTNALKRARAAAVGTTAGGGDIRKGIMGLKGKGAAACGNEPEMGRSSRSIDADAAAELKQLKFPK